MPAKSKAQQHFMGMVRAFQRGELNLADVPSAVADKVKSAAKSMTAKSVRKFAKTPTSELPAHVSEQQLLTFSLAETLEIIDMLDQLTESELAPLVAILEAKKVKVSSDTAAQVYHRDYVKTKKKKYRKYNPQKHDK